jgi:3-methyladenine DNA glycosylase AlkD
MTLKDALKQFEALGSDKMRAQNSKCRAGSAQFGVKRGEIRKVAEKIKCDHALALGLWQTGNVDAQFSAPLVMKPAKLSA